jgi:hypothetical protein
MVPWSVIGIVLFPHSGLTRTHLPVLFLVLTREYRWWSLAGRGLGGYAPTRG